MRTPRHAVLTFAVVAAALVATGCPPQYPPPEHGNPITGADDLPSDPTADTFRFAPVLSGLTEPTNVAFAPDGRVFVTEQTGIIKTFDSIDDHTPTIAADLRAPVRHTGEHGLMGITVDRAYPTRPFVYVSYSWDITGRWRDGCEANYDLNGCVTGARVAKLTMDAQGVMTGSQTLVEDRWCYQFAAHGIGTLESMDDGSLLVTSGEGGNYAGTDYGQWGGAPVFPPIPYVTPPNPCGDPPGGVGFASSPRLSEGGSLRAQDALTPDDPQSWDGVLARIHPDTGQPMPDNPLVGQGTTDNDGVVAFGLRNPHNFTVKPGTDEVYVGDVGQGYAEEIAKISVRGPVRNFGWPCREGDREQSSFLPLDNHLCENLLESPTSPGVLTDPWFFYTRSNSGAAITGLRFVPEGHYPQRYVGDLFFVDYVLGNVFSIALRPDGSRDAVPPEAVAYRPGIVQLVTGPDGYIYGVHRASGTIERLIDPAEAPIADLRATPSSGPVPLTVTLDASGSTTADGGVLTYAWDLDEDGEFDDATGATTTLTLATETNRVVRVSVTDEAGASSTASTTLYPGNTAPTVEIAVTSALPWRAGGPIQWTVTAFDSEDGPLTDAAVEWRTLVRHCYLPTDCHSHPQSSGTGTVGSTTGPSHGYPSYMELVATATDSRGQTVERRLDLHPATATLQVTSNVSGAYVALGENDRSAPFTETVILGDRIDISVPSTQVIDGRRYAFVSWSDGGAASHPIVIEGDLTLNLALTLG